MFSDWSGRKHLVYTQKALTLFFPFVASVERWTGPPYLFWWPTTLIDLANETLPQST